ncbi:FAD-binding oxidoreductase [Streptomyces johnsoniae]|uniref:FAD-binding oxidoreductase n=1 Tax=Streptomyces johnsoniae TaxID=3075532 RepID=A0ABU2S8J9_9ACTN|nr:FAD-binding oxidoreductase [Streptomyces sp. DSM 41886]MDT0445301.1 FAD-binding oxidoreductase [Streptomyces sp. DSM 41886]
MSATGPTGHVFRPGDEGYDAERTGFNLAVDHRPAYVVGAGGSEDVVGAVRRAADRGLGIGVLATGHGPSVPAGEDTVLITTGRMTGVTVDPGARTARVGAGARWHHVIEATAPYGLAPLNGSSPHVGAVGYTLGGGAGLLGRRYGYAADHVRSLDLVPADGTPRTVTADTCPSLFWALRGAGKGNFGVVTAMEIALFPVARLYGGGLYFPAGLCADALHAWAEWTRDLPEEMASSVLLMAYPDVPEVPGPLRGHHVTHLRIAWSGPPAEGEPLVAPLRAVGTPLLDTVSDMPYRDVGAIHHEPTASAAAHDRGTLLTGLPPAAVDTLLATAGPAARAPFVTELRHFGGAYARPPRVPNAVGHRTAAFSLYTGADPAAGDAPDRLHVSMRPWSGGSFLNFLGSGETEASRLPAAFDPGDYARLTELKRTYDPANVFRVNHNIPPGGALSP